MAMGMGGDYSQGSPIKVDSAVSTAGFADECPAGRGPVTLPLVDAEFGVELDALLPTGWWLYSRCKRNVRVS